MSTLAKDPATGAFTGTGGRSVVDLTGGSAQPGSGDSYTKFNSELASMLVQMRNASAAGRTNLEGAKDFLTTESNAPAGQKSFDPNIGADSQTQGQQTLRTGFTPAITSINTQMENTDKAIGDLGTDIGSLETAYQPVTVNAGQSLMTKDGTLLSRPPSYLSPQIRQDTGNLDSFDQANGVWKSDTMSAGGNGPGSNGYGADAHPVTSTNNNPFGIKFTPYTQKLFGDSGINVASGTAATDGGNFIQFDSPTQAEKATRLLLQSPVYAKDTVDQALRAWSNNGYNGTILKGTGLDPNSYVKDLSGVQMDTLMAAMLKAEQGIGDGGVKTDGGMTPSKDPKGNLFNPTYAARVAQIPQAAQKFVLAGPSGVAYVDGDTAATAGYDKLFATIAPRAGLPVLTSGGVSAVNEINTIALKIQNMKGLVDKNLSNPSIDDNSFVGHLYNSIGANVNKISQNNPDLTEMQSYINSVVSAASQIKALAGGPGTGLRITGFEIGSAQDAFPQVGDSWQTAQKKIQALDQQVTDWMHTNFPDVSDTQPITPQSQTAAPAAKTGGATVDINALRTKYHY